MSDLFLVALSLSGLFLLGLVALLAEAKAAASPSLRREQERAVAEAIRWLRLSDRARTRSHRSSSD